MGKVDWLWFQAHFRHKWDENKKWFRDLATFFSVPNKSSKSVIIHFLENSPVSWGWKVSTYHILCKIVYFMGIVLKSKLLI